MKILKNNNNNRKPAESKKIEWNTVEESKELGDFKILSDKLQAHSFNTVQVL